VKLVVLGHPIGHSLSPAMMTAALRAAGIEGTYTARDLPPPLARADLDALLEEGVHGANVTVPHKEAALACADDASDAARAIGAANLLARGSGGGWHAHNTDAPGFLEWIESFAPARARAGRAVVLGAGGSARAVVWALLSRGADRVHIVNRTRARAEALAAAFGERVVVVDPREGLRALPDDALFVQCTSLGLRPDDALPIDDAALARAGCVLDLVYPNTPFVRAARVHGLPAEDGLGLLVAQAALGFALWTGCEADRNAMRAAAREELSRRAPPGSKPA
jgi:shikimate dehydrogenase